MMDYAVLTDDELDRMIAERRGWTGVKAVARSKTIKPTFLGFPPESTDGYADTVPHWSTDLNAAADLLKDMILGALFRDDETTDWNVTAFIDGFGLVVDVHHELPARAICLGYLTYTEKFRASGFYPATGKAPVLPPDMADGGDS